MITDEMKDRAAEVLVGEWGHAGYDILCLCYRRPALNMTSTEFLTHCTACGGNWGAMLMTGMAKLAPDVWELLPEHLGRNGNEAFANLCYVLMLLGVDTTA